MNLQENVLRRIKSYDYNSMGLDEETLARLRKLYIDPKYHGEFARFERGVFYTLNEALSRFKELNLSNNGTIEIAMPFDEVVSILGLHSNPKEIKPDSGFGNLRAISTMYPQNSMSHISDSSEGILEGRAGLKFNESFFGLALGTFKTRIIEPNYGLRVDMGGQLKHLLEKILDDNIAMFIHTADLGWDSEPKFYIINGFDV